MVLVAVVLGGCAVTPSASPSPARTPTKTAIVTAKPKSPPARVTTRPKSPPGRATTIPVSPPVTKDGLALSALATLPVKGRAPKTGYDRAQFGQAWSDDVSVQGGHNGCDTRNDVLRRDLRQVTLKPGRPACTVLSGTLPDPYSGQPVPFQRGKATSSDVQIDHVVALGNAWQTGAQQLSVERRQDLGNDPLNLWAVSGKLNQQKSDGDAATWLPPNKAVRCLYVARQIAVKAAYKLWVTQAERDAMKQLLDGCPKQPLPTADNWKTPALATS